MKYICQISDGWMLVQWDNGRIGVKNTGYPYPDLGKPNYDMLRDLVKKELNILHDSDWYMNHWGTFKKYLQDKICKNVHYIDLYKLIKLMESDSKVEGKIYRLPDMDGIALLYVENPANIVEFKLEMYSDYISNANDFVRRNESFIVALYIDNALLEGIKKASELCAIDYMDETFKALISMTYKEILLSFRFLTQLGFINRCYPVSKYGLERIIHDGMNDEFTVRSMLNDKFLKYCIWYANKEYNIHISDVIDFLASHTKGGLIDLADDSISLHKDIMYELIINTAKLENRGVVNDSELSKEFLKVVSATLKKCVVTFVNTALDRFTCDESNTVFKIDGTSVGVFGNACFKGLYDNFTEFKEAIDDFFCYLRPSTITNSEIIWNLNDYLDEGLANKVGHYLFYEKADISVSVMSANLIVSNPLSVLNCLFKDLSRLLIFDNDFIEKIKTILKHSFPSAINMILPPEFLTLEEYKDYSDFMLLFANNNQVFTKHLDDSMNGSLSSHRYYYKFNLGLDDYENNTVIHTDMSKETFEKLKVFFIVEFLRRHFINGNLFYRYKNKVRLEDFKVSFDEEEQLVSIVLDLDMEKWRSYD